MTDLNSALNTSISPQKKPMSKIKKILLGVVISIVAVIFLSLFFTQGISDAARKQLQAIGTGDVAKAYGMTSTAFQQETAYDDFVKFIDQYPVLKHSKDIHFSERKIDNGTGYLAGTIEGENSSKMTIEFQLVKENDEWKIQAMRLTPVGTLSSNDSQTTSAGPLVIDSILVSNVADSDGYVQSDNIHIPRTAQKIYATVRVVAPEKGTEILAVLTHTRSGDKIGPVKGVISTTGNIMKAFSFTRGNAPWPKGDYEVLVTTSTGATKMIRFDVK